MNKNKFKDILKQLLKIFVSTIGNIIITYLIPIINIIIIYVIKNNNQLSIYNCLNILLATNACNIIGITNYLKINENYNNLYNVLRNIGLGICLVCFGISTYEIEINSVGKIPINIYIICTILTFIISFVLMLINEKEEIDRNDVFSNAKKIISKSKKISNQENIDGETFKF